MTSSVPVDGLDELQCGGLASLHLFVVFLCVKVAVKGFPVGGGIASAGHSLGEMGAADDVSASNFLHFGKIKLDSFVVQECKQVLALLVPSRLHPAAQVL